MIRQVYTEVYDDNLSYFVGDDKGNAAVIDPGNVPLMKMLIEEKVINLKAVMITHSHHDHVEGVKDIAEEFGVPVYMHKNAAGRLEGIFDFEVLVEDRESIKVGEIELKVLYTPGHIDDAVCYFVKKGQEGDLTPKIFTGDTLFVEGCGRADLEGSDPKKLFSSLQKLKSLPPETVVYPGHDYGSRPVSTIGEEIKKNPYFKCKTLEEFLLLRMG